MNAEMRGGIDQLDDPYFMGLADVEPEENEWLEA